MIPVNCTVLILNELTYYINLLKNFRTADIFLRLFYKDRIYFSILQASSIKKLTHNKNFQLGYENLHCGVTRDPLDVLGQPYVAVLQLCCFWGLSTTARLIGPGL